MKRATIDYTTKPFTYYDKYGNIINPGDYIKNNLCGVETIKKVYLLEDEERLGIDSTNQSWIATGRAYPCQYGCYPLNHEDLETYELATEDEAIIKRNKEMKIALLKEKIANKNLDINNLYYELSLIEKQIEDLKKEKDLLEKELKVAEDSIHYTN